MKIIARRDFSLKWSPMDEDIVGVGKKKTGKSTVTKDIINLIPHTPWWLYDYSNQFSGYGTVVHKVQDLKYGQYVLQPWDKSYKTCQAYYNKINFEMANMVNIHDEIHQYVTKQGAYPEINTTVQSKRNEGISSIFLSTRPQSIPNFILDNNQHILAFPVNLRTSVEWLDEYLGDLAWLLFPPDKRKKIRGVPMFNGQVLAPYSFIYRNLDEDESIVVGGITDNKAEIEAQQEEPETEPTPEIHQSGLAIEVKPEPKEEPKDENNQDNE